MNMAFKKAFLLYIWIFLWASNTFAEGKILRFIYCSDLHYGLKREFRGHIATSAEVNRALLETFRLLETTRLPQDDGVLSGEVFGEADFIVCTGDIANRMEKGIQTASVSWEQFSTDWLEHIRVPFYLVPGNHDISNAIGYPKPLSPSQDATSATELYNLTMQPAHAKTCATFNYLTDKVHYCVEQEGIRFVFMGMWPDKNMRAWYEQVFAKDTLTPAFLFTHDPPNADTKHFTNPNGDHSINAEDKFENLLADTCSVHCITENATREWHALEEFIRRHPTIKAYFHGDKNYNEFYTWNGTKGSIALPVFRVDSPMKGELSAEDEHLLSFIVATIDTQAQQLTVRECLWNTEEKTGIAWGESRTIHY